MHEGSWSASCVPTTQLKQKNQRRDVKDTAPAAAPGRPTRTPTTPSVLWLVTLERRTPCQFGMSSGKILSSYGKQIGF